MEKNKIYENYPFYIVFLSNLLSIMIYLIGAYIIYKLGLIWMIIYVIYILILEFRLIKNHCANCYYYGKTCAFGQGRISKIFFKKGTPNKFCKIQMTWKEILPDFMVSLIPAVIGIILLIKDFDLALLILIIALFLLTFNGNALIRGKLACRHCKQRELGCPAQKLFEKRK